MKAVPNLSRVQTKLQTVVVEDNAFFNVDLKLFNRNTETEYYVKKNQSNKNQ